MTQGYFENNYLTRRDLNDEIKKIVENYINLLNTVTGAVDYFANLPTASAHNTETWLVRYQTTILGIIIKQAGLYISDGTNWNWMTSLDAKADKTTTINTGLGLTGGGDLSANRTISHNDTSSQANVVNTNGNVLQSANLDDFGHITSFTSTDLDSRYVLLSGAYANPTWITSLGADKLTGTIPSGVLGASTVYVGTTAIALNRASNNQALTGISSIQYVGSTSGGATLQAPAVAGTTIFTLPTTTGNLIGSGDTGTVTNTMLAGSIADSKLNTITTAGKVANSSTTAVSTNTGSTIVLRDASGNFSAGTITGALSGNSTTATTLQTARNINGVSFNGSSDITVTANTTNALTINNPLTGASFNGGSAVSIGIQTANSTQAGALSSTDWSTFNNKQSAITLTTTGNSGASTFTSNTLNIPTYTLTGLGGQPALSGSGIVKSTAGTISYLTDNSSNWDTAYNRSPTALAISGTTTKTLTLTKQDSTTLTASWSDLNTDAVSSVFGRTGAIVATEGDYSLNLLSDVAITTPATNQLLQYNGTTWLNWSPNYLTLTSLSATSPLSYNNTTGAFSIAQSNTTTNGFLSSTDWNTFNNKQATISLTTTGNSGASSFASNVLNIPNYTLTGLGGQPALNGTGFVKISGTTISYDNSTYLTGNQTITLSGDITGSGTTAITTTLANSGATAGTYQNATTINPLTIDAKGRITSTGTAVTIAPLFSSIASKPTTISGYGITDGATLTGTQTLTNKTFTDNTTFFQDDLDNTKKAQFQLSSIATATTRTYTLPNNNGIIITTGDTGTVSNGMLAGSIADSKLSTITTAGKVSNSATTATNANTASAIVARDASGNFNAGTITASLSGNSTTATTLQTARTINGVSFNGSANITVEDNTKLPLAGGTLTGQLISTLASGSQLYLNGSTSNQIEFNTNGTGTPTFTTRSAGSKIIVYPFISSADTDFAIGMDVPIGALWQSVGNTACIFKWYFGDSERANLTPDRFSCFGFEVYDITGYGYFKVSNYFGGNTIATLSTNDATDNAPVVVNPKIPYCVNATNGYNGTLTGANIRFASDTTATNIWDIGVGANAVGTDTFSIGRNNTSLFTMTSTGNITTQLISTRANNTATGSAQIYLNGATGNRIDFNSNGIGNPTFTTRSIGTKIVLYPQVGASAVDHALGIASNTMWLSVPNTSNQFTYYAGTTVISRLRDTGISSRGVLYEGNSAFTTLSTTSTLTIAQLLTLVIESTPTANITFTLPTGTLMDAGVMASLETNRSFVWSIVNIATGFTITMAGGTAHTYVGNTTIAANTSASFRSQKTATNTFRTVRI